MNKQLRIVLIILGIAIAILPALTFSIISEKTVIGEQLCVDGNNNINLEGMMCEETEFTVKGMSQETGKIISYTSGIVGLIIFGFSMFAESETRYEK